MRYVDWSEDSFLSETGYKADGSLSLQGRHRCLDRAIEGDMRSALAVIEHLRWLIDDRGYRLVRAENIWREDIAYVARWINNQ